MRKPEKKYKSRINYFLFGILIPIVIVFIAFYIMEETRNVTAWIVLLVLAFIVAFGAMTIRVKSLNMEDTIMTKIFFTSPLLPIVALYLLFAPNESIIKKKKPKGVRKGFIYILLLLVVAVIILEVMAHYNLL